MRPQYSRFATLVIAVAVAAIVGYATIWQDAPFQHPDTESYLNAARDLSDGKLDQLHDRPPGYPLLLLATGSSSSPGRTLFYVQLAMHFVAVICVILTMRYLKVSNWLVVLFFLICASPPAVVPSANVLTECFTEFLLAIGICFLVMWLAKGRNSLLLMASLATAMAALARPVYQYLSIGIVAGLLVLPFVSSWRSQIKRLCVGALVLTVVCIVVIGGVAFYNQRHFGYAGLSPRLGATLCLKTSPFLERLPDEYAKLREVLIAHRDEELVRRGGNHDGLLYIWESLPEIQREMGMQRLEMDRELMKANVYLISHAPLLYAHMVARSAVQYCFPSITLGPALIGSRASQLLWSCMHFVLLGILIVNLTLFLGGTALLWHGRRALSRVVSEGEMLLVPLRLATMILIVVVLAYTMACSTLVEIGLPRYRSPTDLLALFLMVLLIDNWQHMKRWFKQWNRESQQGGNSPKPM